MYVITCITEVETSDHKRQVMAAYGRSS